MHSALPAPVVVDIPAQSTTPCQDAWTVTGFDAVYQEHSRAIYYLALRLLGDAALAEDATHDVFLKAYRKFHTFRGDAAVRTWLYRIAVNHCQNLLQSWHRRHIVTGLDDHLAVTQSPLADNPLRILEIKELGQRIQRTLEALPEEYRLLLLLLADEQLSYQQIAELTRQSVDAVRGKLHRARKAFANLFHKTA
jgi:RNA polymerase sigma-70 factor, ECF subfamily